MAWRVTCAIAAGGTTTFRRGVDRQATAEPRVGFPPADERGPRPRRLAARATAAALATFSGALLTLVPQTATAAPANPSDGKITTAQAAQETAAAGAGRVAGLVAAADAELQLVSLQPQAAQVPVEQAQAQADFAELGRESYMGDQARSAVAVRISAERAGEMLQRAATLESDGV